jgi:hypothetical protein
MQERVIMAREDDETIEMDMPPEEARRLLESQDEKSEDLDKHSDNFSEPLKVRAKEIYDRLKKIYTGQVTLDDWYGGFAVSIKPEKDIEGWEWIADECEKRRKKFFLRSRKTIFKKVLEESKQKWPTGVAQRDMHNY